MALFSIRKFVFILLAVLVMVTSVAAQQTPVDAPKEAPTSRLQDLIDVLRDDKTRDALLNELEKATGAEPSDRTPEVPVTGMYRSVTGLRK